MLHHFKQLLPAPILPHPKYLLKKHLYFNIFDYFQDEKAFQNSCRGSFYAQKALKTKAFLLISIAFGSLF